MKHEMKLSEIPFRAIREGQKVIESRLYDEKRAAISIGDEIVFASNEDSQQSVTAKVVGILRYASFERLFRDHNPSMFGGESTSALLEQIRQFYSHEEEAKYGVVGIRIEVIE